MVMVGCVVLASGCRTPPPMPGTGVLQVLAKELLLHEIKAVEGKVILGGRALADDGKVIHGHGEKGIWRLHRDGARRIGKVEGEEARLTLVHDAKQIVVAGHVGKKTVKIRGGDAAILMVFHDMDLQLAPKKGASGVKIYCDGTTYCLRLHPSLTWDHAGMPLALLLATVQMYKDSKARQRRINPDWNRPKPDYFQGGGQWR